MIETTLDIHALPELVFNMIKTTKIKISQAKNGVISLTPICEKSSEKSDILDELLACALRVRCPSINSRK
ncbi:MAG: hypothetical protein LBU39_06925 [Desulfobulbaceae bacterium]|jgi:hypothetical protein|nr:hypothetical protein [Desulfobulbaceae bacterium]